MKRNLTRICLCLSVLSMACWFAFGVVTAEAKSRKGLRKYTVQRGESCWSIALKLYGSGKKYNVIHKHNRLGPEPHILKPGQVIYIPGTAKKADASIVWLRKRVQARPPRTLDWLRARRRMSLWKLYKVKTGDRSSVGLRFDDKSFMKMREQALLVIYGSSAQRVQSRRLVQRTVVVERGVVKGGLDSLDGKSSLTVKTPAGEIKLKSKLAQIEVGKKKMSSLSVYDGNATMKAQGKKVKVPKNYGTYAKRGRKPAKPVPLPAAPLWQGGQHEAVVFVPRGQFGQLTFRWKPVARAQQYRFELSSQPDFRVILNDETYPPRKRKALPGVQEVAALVGKGVLGFRHLRLRPGVYYARVAARDNYKLEGYPSKTLRIKVLPMHTTRRLHRAPDGVFETVGLLGILPPKDKTVEVSHNGGAFAAFTAPLRISKPGLQTLKFRPKKPGAVQTTLNVRLLSVNALLKGPTQRIKTGSGKHALSLKLRAKFSFVGASGSTSKKAIGVTLPGLEMVAYPGGKLPLVDGKPGHFKASFVAPARHPGGDVVVVARWAGGELARTTIAMIGPPAPRVVRPLPPKKIAQAPIFDWTTAAVSMEWANSGPAMPSRAARPSTSLQLSSFLQQRKFPLDGATADQLLLRMSFIGELSLLDKRLGFDLEVPWMQLNLLEDSADRVKLGDIRVGGRFVVYRSQSLLLTPSLRVSIPTGGVARAHRSAVFEPGLLLAWRAASWLTFHTNQLFVIETDFVSQTARNGLYYTSYYGAEVRPSRLLSFALELDLVLGAALGDPFTLQGFGASAAIRLHFDRARIALVGGGHFTEQGQIGLGGFSIGLNFAFGFQGL